MIFKFELIWKQGAILSEYPIDVELRIHSWTAAFNAGKLNSWTHILTSCLKFISSIKKGQKLLDELFQISLLKTYVFWKNAGDKPKLTNNSFPFILLNKYWKQNGNWQWSLIHSLIHILNLKIMVIYYLVNNLIGATLMYSIFRTSAFPWLSKIQIYLIVIWPKLIASTGHIWASSNNLNNL